jgi:L-alanine-DL-glutamate epimerase-like enolase superfamily enzyme
MPMKRPFAHARATRKIAESVVVRLRWDGEEGLGECVPRRYVTGETPNSVFEALTAFDPSAAAEVLAADGYRAAVPLLEALDLPARLRQRGRPGPAAACALELALLDLVGRRSRASLREVAAALPPPAELRDRGAPHPFSRALDGSREAAAIFGEGERALYAVLKIKVGLGREEDLARVRAAREEVGPDFTISVDANMAWSLDEACAMADLLRPLGIAWYEEPLARGALADYAELRRRTGVRVMLDESLTSLAEAEAAIAQSACDLFNIRVSKCGGLVASLRLAELAHRQGLGFQLGTHPGAQAILRAAEWQLMNMLGGFVAVEAARTHAWFEEELVREPLEIDRTERRARPLAGPGLGIALVPERLERHTDLTATWDPSRGSWRSET